MLKSQPVTYTVEQLFQSDECPLVLKVGIDPQSDKFTVMLNGLDYHELERHQIQSHTVYRSLVRHVKLSTVKYQTTFEFLVRGDKLRLDMEYDQKRQRYLASIGKSYS